MITNWQIAVILAVILAFRWPMMNSADQIGEEIRRLALIVYELLEKRR